MLSRFFLLCHLIKILFAQKSLDFLFLSLYILIGIIPNCADGVGVVLFVFYENFDIFVVS